MARCAFLPSKGPGYARWNNHVGPVLGGRSPIRAGMFHAAKPIKQTDVMQVFWPHAPIQYAAAVPSACEITCLTTGNKENWLALQNVDTVFHLLRTGFLQYGVVNQSVFHTGLNKMYWVPKSARIASWSATASGFRISITLQPVGYP